MLYLSLVHIVLRTLLGSNFTVPYTRTTNTLLVQDGLVEQRRIVLQRYLMICPCSNVNSFVLVLSNLKVYRLQRKMCKVSQPKVCLLYCQKMRSRYTMYFFLQSAVVGFQSSGISLSVSVDQTTTVLSQNTHGSKFTDLQKSACNILRLLIIMYE